MSATTRRPHPHPMARQLVSASEACAARGQHTKPCADCPWGRKALPGWLGSNTSAEWLQIAHSECQIECHTALGAQCAGAAIYRANVCKSIRTPAIIRLPRDAERVFATPMEFRAHHDAGSGTLAARARAARVECSPSPTNESIAMSTRPTPEEVAKEVTKLRQMKPSVRKENMFGDNHHEAIDAQIEVMEKRLDEDDIYAAYGDDTAEDFSQNLLDSAIEDRRWLDGEESEAPSAGWQDLVK
jgi:hypothetical protein